MLKNISKKEIRFTGKEDVVVLPVFERRLDLKGPGRKLDVLCRSGISSYLKRTKFKGEAGETALVGFQLPKAPGHVLVVGLGPEKSLTPGRIAAAGGSASKVLKSGKFSTCHALLDGNLELDSGEDLVRAFLKGVALAQYAFSMKTARPSGGTLKKLVVLADDTRRLPRIIKNSRITTDSIAMARDLVNRPANDLTPAGLAGEAKTVCEKYGLHCRVLGRTEMEKLGMGAILGVAGGSREDPALVSIHYNKDLSAKTKCLKVCLVGKGVTFDSGGISLKPWQSMNEMKGDMAGGAVVLQGIAAAARLRSPIEIVGLIPCVENMPDGSAIRPGDIVKTYSGKTIEVISTDAEGRLILADALTYALEWKPDLVIDIATLTGSVVVALGTRIAGAVGNDQKYIERLIAAGNRTGELVWQLPLDDSFKDMVKGEISDLKNFSGRDGGTITAAALLSGFVGDTPWIHIDIAGTFWSQDGKVSYQPKGATGFGVDLILRFLESLADDGKTG
ncbi:MAG: leucyl aminopeptidase [bacterium]